MSYQAKVCHELVGMGSGALEGKKKVQNIRKALARIQEKERDKQNEVAEF